MRALPLFVCAAFAWGCSDRNSSTEADAATSVPGESAGGGGWRCVVRDPVPVVQSPTIALVGLPWITRGPEGYRAYARVGSGAELQWRAGLNGGDVPAYVGLREGAFGWAGERFVAVLSSDDEGTPHRVVTLDAHHGDLLPLRTALPPGACDPAVTEMGGRAMLTWRKRTREGCEAGEGWFQILGRRGEPIGPARQLDEGGVDVRVRELKTRWDFGRAVIIGRRDMTGLDEAWVVDPAGEVLWSGFASGAEGVVACPRGGCLRVRVGHEVSATDGLGGNSLRFERLAGTGGGFGVSAVVSDVVGVAVSGDRVLALHSPSMNASGCDLTVVDLTARAVVAQHHADGLACDERRVHATPRGFVIASADTASGASRQIDCGW